MDVRTLGFATGLVAFALALLSVLIAAMRRQRSSAVYAAGFVSAAAGFSLLMTQERVSWLISIVLANLLALFTQACMAWGIRLKTESARPWPMRFWAWMGAAAAVLIAGKNSFPLRAIGISVLAIVFSFEFMAATGRGLRPAGILLRRVAWVLGTAFSAFYSVRVVLIAAGTSSAGLFVENRVFSLYSLSFLLFFQILWAGLVMFIDAAGLMEELERKNRALNNLAVTDTLTGLFNRNLLEANLRADMERSRRYGEPLSILILDLDHFKRVNDIHGHLAGDAVLRQVAGILRAVTRKSEVVYRWGGEEFIIVAPNTGSEGARFLAEKLRTAVAASDFPVVGRMTASIGVAEWGGTEDQEAWFRRVDLALYRAKNSGRNRVEAIAVGEDLTGAVYRIEWSGEWASGDPSIDAEHRGLVELCNELMGRSLARASAAELDAVLDRLIAEAELHFRHEEAALSAVGWSGLREHAELHRHLLARARDLRAGAAGAEGETGAYFDFLVDDLVMGHLVGEDARYFPALSGARPERG